MRGLQVHMQTGLRERGLSGAKRGDISTQGFPANHVER